MSDQNKTPTEPQVYPGGGLVQVQGVRRTRTPTGWEGAEQLPTFTLDPGLFGVCGVATYARIAARILGPGCSFTVCQHGTGVYASFETDGAGVVVDDWNPRMAAAVDALHSIDAVLYADGPDTEWDSDTLDDVASILRAFQGGRP